MISRRSFTALAGATLFGLLGRIRFAPSGGGPRGRRTRRGSFATRDFGGFEFSLTDDRLLFCKFQGKRMPLTFPVIAGKHHFAIHDRDAGYSSQIVADLRDDDSVSVREVIVYRKTGGQIPAFEWPNPGRDDLRLVFEPDYWFGDPPNPALLERFDAHSGEFILFSHNGDQLLG